MADEGAHWSFQLVDGITSAAAKMEASVRSLEAALKHTDTSIQGSHEATKQHTESVFGAMGESFKSLQETAFFVTENIARAWEGVRSVLESVSEGIEYVFDAADFRRNALIGLNAMLSTGYQADAVLEKLEGWARQTGMAKDAFTTFGKQLLGEGFQEGELKPLLAALSDVQGANQGKVEASQELLQMFGRIRATDQVNARELAQFGQLGIKPDQIYGALARERNITLAQAATLFKTDGAVKGTDAINAILGAIQGGMDKGGPLGKLGEDWALGSIPAQAQRAKDALSDLFDKVDTAPFAHAIAHVTAQLDGAAGAKFAKSMDSAFAKLGDWIGQLDFDKVGAGLGEVADDLGKAADFAGQLFTGLKSGWDDMAPAVGLLGQAIGAIFASDAGGSDVKLFAQSVMDVVDAFVVLGEVVVFSAAAMGRGIVTVVEGLAWVVSAVVGLGADIVEGLWRGMKSAWAGLLSGFHELLAELPASVRHVLGIASPSKVFAELGGFTMQGFTAGLDSVNVQEHLVRHLAPPRAERFAALGEAGGEAYGDARAGSRELPLSPNARPLGEGGGAGSGRSLTIRLDAPIHVSGVHDAQAAAEAMVGEMRRVLLPELAGAIDELTIEVGG